jgi:pimeloyl-ACP methyl ester carboxylesterase
MEMVEVNGLHIAYERAGSGPALVLLHGYVGDGPTTWGRQLDGLSDEFTVIAWDAPGAGRSTDPPERFGLDGYADCLAGFLKELGSTVRVWPDCRSAASSPLRSSGETPPSRAP